MFQSQHEIKTNETRNSGLVRWRYKIVILNNWIFALVIQYIDIAELVTFCFAGNISENM